MSRSKTFKWIFPTVLAFVLLSFELLFSAYMLPSERSILLIIAVLNFFIYFSFMVFRIFKEKTPVKKILILVVLSITASACFIKFVWFSGYLCLNPFNKLFSGNFHADTLSHSALAESIISNGYPSILFNTKNIFHYHFGSHYVMAGISRLLAIHAFSAYNWCYPIVFLPLFFLLFFSAIESFRKISLSVQEIIFIVFFCFIGFLPKSLMDNSAFWISSFFLSESFCIGLICLFIYFIVLNKINIFSIENYAITFLFIFICSSMKISIGCLMWIFCCWYSLRKKGLLKTIPIGLLLTIALGLSIYLFNEKVGSASNHKVYLLHYYRNFVVRDSLIFHVVVVYWLLAIGLYYTLKGKAILQEIKNGGLVLEESIIMATVVSILPGSFLYVEGGSAFYFFAVMYPVFILYFLSKNGVEIAFVSLKGNKILMSMLLFVFGGTSLFNCITSAETIYRARPPIHNSVLSVMETKLYNQMESLRKEDRMHTAVIVEKDSDLFNVYQNKDYRSLSYFIQAYTGLPVYGMYERIDGNILLITGDFVQIDVSPLYFGLDYEEVFSQESLIDKVKSDGIEKVLYVGANGIISK